jgi:DNA polymerase (family X)
VDKANISRILEEMGTLLELQGANPFKARAFHNASRAVEGITEDLRTLSIENRLVEVKGIGKSIAQIIADLALKDRSDEYNELRKGVPEGVLQMLRITGLGPKKVKLLFEKKKITSVDELERAARAGKLAALDGFGAKTEKNILAGIDALRKRSDRVLFRDAIGPATALCAMLLKLPGVRRGAVAGSLRRRRETIGDIDIVLSAPDSARVAIMKAFVGHNLVHDIIAEGETKSSIHLDGGLQCDLRVVDDASYPFALNYFTGSKEHNVELRGRARPQGLSLNEYGFSKSDGTEARSGAKSVVKCKDEEEIYAALGLQFVPPELRENLGEIEAAQKKKLPRLVEEKDLRGTFHCHSTWSDGLHSIAQMAAAAKAQGWEYLGIADHSRVAAYAGGLSPAKVKDQLKEIEALNAKNGGIRIFAGTECDILPDGSLDWPEKILASFEYVVISIHSNFSMSEAAMTKRIIKALKNKYVTMLGHPTGRLLLSRDPYPVNMAEVLKAAADYGKAVEINAHPMRLDLDWRLGRAAVELGIPIAINPDAHAIDGLRDVSFGVGIARKGWLEARHIINTRPVAEVEKYFKRR